MLPNFFIVGAQKSGTTSLFEYLAGHPQVFVPAVKEPDFFVPGVGDRKGLAWYESLFATAGKASAVGEASTTYSMYPTVRGVPERLFAAVPKARIIYLMRDPIERIRSNYIHTLALGQEHRPIEVAVLADETYLVPSRYATQVEQYLPYTGAERLLLLTAEELWRDRQALLRRVLEFLDVDADWTPSNLDTDYHPSAGKRMPRAGWRRLGGLLARYPAAARLVPARLVAMRERESRLLTRPIRPEQTVVTPQLRARLVELLAPEVQRLRRLLPDLEGWGIA